MATAQESARKAGTARPRTAEVIMRGGALAISCVISYWLITHLLARTYSVSRDDDCLGGMWAVAATIFVFRYSQEESTRAALSRMAATAVSFALCLLYLSIFSFHLWGMAALIGAGTVIVTIIDRADDTITTGITIAVIMVVAELSPHDAWRQPILRLVDTAVGIAVGVGAARIGNVCLPRRSPLRTVFSGQVAPIVVRRSDR